MFSLISNEKFHDFLRGAFSCDSELLVNIAKINMSSCSGFLALDLHQLILFFLESSVTESTRISSFRAMLKCPWERRGHGVFVAPWFSLCNIYTWELLAGEMVLSSMSLLGGPLVTAAGALGGLSHDGDSHFWRLSEAPGEGKSHSCAPVSGGNHAPSSSSLSGEGSSTGGSSQQFLLEAGEETS